MSERWREFACYSDAASAEVAAGLLRSEGVPVNVASDEPMTGLRRVLVAAISILTFGPHAGAQTAKPVVDVVVAPFVVETDDEVDTLRAQANSCSEDLVKALAVKAVAVARGPTLSEKNLQSTSASWAVLGRITREKEQFQLELRLLEVKSGEELRSYFNADKDLKVACRAVDKVAERIAAFVVEQKRAQQ